MVGRTVLLTWKPRTTFHSPFNLARSLVEQLVEPVRHGGALEVQWRCWMHPQPGDLAVILMQGEKPNRIYATGEIVGLRYRDTSGVPRVPVMLSKMIPPFEGFDASTLLTSSESNSQRSGLSYLSEQSVERLQRVWSKVQEEQQDYAGHMSWQLSKSRIAHAKFAHTVKENYGYKCCICGLASREFIIGAHIIRWADNESSRLDPMNGLSLCVLHDRAFERGYLTLRDDYSIAVSNACDQTLLAYLRIEDGQKTSLPRKAAPALKYVQEHRRRFHR